jgi:hypothetical protein
MSDKRIPEDQLGFNTYVIGFKEHVNRLEPDGTTRRGITLGMTPGEITKTDDLTKQWVSGDPSNPGIWDKHSKPATKTSVTTEQVKEFKKTYNEFLRPILVRISGSPNITAEDRQQLHIAAPVTSHTTPTTPIKEKCIMFVQAAGGGSAEFTFRLETDSTRASLPDTADAVEIRTRLDAPVLEEVDEKSNELASKIKRETLSSPDDGTTKEYRSKAIFKISYGADKAGFTLHVYARFINTKHPGLEGDWTGPIWISLS